MTKVYSWRIIVPILLTMVLSTACTDNDDNGGGSSQSTAVDAGPVFTEKTVDVNRNGQAYGQVTLRF